MKNYNINIVEYEEILENENKPYEMLLNPLTLEQFKHSLENGFTSYIRNRNQADFLELYFKQKVGINENSFKLNLEDVFVAIRFMGEELPLDIKDLKVDNDIEIYYVKLLNYNI